MGHLDLACTRINFPGYDMVRRDRKIRLAAIRASIVCIMLVCTCAMETGAKELPADQVGAAVRTWIRKSTADARPDAVLERLEPYQVSGRTVAYIAHLKGGGFALCSRDDLLLPVYLYVPEGEYDPENPEYKYILEEIAAREAALRQTGEMESLQQGFADEFARRRVLWKTLSAGAVPVRAETSPVLAPAAPEMIDLGLTTRWRQQYPYNSLTPFLTDSAERTLVGCTSTAFSQIMYYWKWPNSGTGTVSGTYDYRYRTTWDQTPLAANPNTAEFPGQWRGRLDWTSGSGGRLWMNGYWDRSIYDQARLLSQDTAYLTALDLLYNRLTTASKNYTVNPGSTTYNWSLLEDIHADPPDAGDSEVAKLNYQVAVAVDTSFGVDFSGSDWWRLEGASGGPAQNFSYDPDATYTNPKDLDMMVEEIQWMRPFGMGGGPPGHGWVIFGYNKGLEPWQFKMNMGWGGVSAWYSMDKVPLGIIQNHNHLTHIAPAGVVRFVGGGVSGDGSPKDPYADLAEALQNSPAGTTLIFKAGSDNTFFNGGTGMTINKKLTLRGIGVTLRHQ